MRCSRTQKNLAFMVGLLLGAPAVSIGTGYAVAGSDGAVIGLWSALIFDLGASIANFCYHDYGFFSEQEDKQPAVETITYRQIDMEPSI